MKVGDLVRMKIYETGRVGIVVERYHHPGSTLVGIRWFKGSGKVDWEPEAWLEILSEGR